MDKNILLITDTSKIRGKHYTIISDFKNTYKFNLLEASVTSEASNTQS